MLDISAGGGKLWLVPSPRMFKSVNAPRLGITSWYKSVNLKNGLFSQRNLENNLETSSRSYIISKESTGILRQQEKDFWRIEKLQRFLEIFWES